MVVDNCRYCREWTRPLLDQEYETEDDDYGDKMEQFGRQVEAVMLLWKHYNIVLFVDVATRIHMAGVARSNSARDVAECMARIWVQPNRRTYELIFARDMPPADPAHDAYFEPSKDSTT